MFSVMYRSGRDGRSRGLRALPHSQESIGPVVAPAVAAAASASVTSATATSTATPTGGAVVVGAVAGGGGAEALSPDKRRQRALTQAPSPGRPFRRSNDLTGEWSRYRGTRFF